MRASRGRCARLLAIALVLASILLTGACAGSDSVTLVATAPVDDALSIFTNQGSTVTAYRARDGSTRWTSNPVSEDNAPDDSFWYADGLVFGWTFNSSEPDHLTLVAVDSADGHLRWRVRVEGTIPPPLAITRDYIVLQLGTQQSLGPLRVIRLSDGVQVHDIPLAAGGGWIAADGDTVFQCTYDAVLTAFRLDDGQPLWTVPVAPGSAIPGQGCPLEAGDGIVLCHVSVSTPDGQRANELAALRESDGRRLWRKPLGLDDLEHGVGYYFAASTGSPGQVPAGSLVAYRTVDAQILWQVPADLTGDLTGDITGDGSVLVFPQGADLRAVRASDGASLWLYKSPAQRTLRVEGVADGLVFAVSFGNWGLHNPAPLGTDTRPYLLVLGANDGRLYWQRPLNSSGDITIGRAS
jgi:outer membrane protein assembly factor BamB